MEKEMIRSYIYQILSTRSDEKKYFTLNECVNMMKYDTELIQKEGLEAIQKKIYATYGGGNTEKPEHIVRTIQKKLMELNTESYIKTLESATRLMAIYSRNYRRNYDALFLISSHEQVDYLADKIIMYGSYTIEQLLDEIHSTKDEKRRVLLKYVLSMKYFYDMYIAKSTEILKEIENYSIDAKYSLARSYQEGYGVKKDEQKAYNIYRELMNTDIIARYRVAVCLYDGSGVQKDYDEAFKLCNELYGELPYDLDFAIEFILGEMHFYGRGTEENKQKGFKMMEEAWNSGCINLNYKSIKEVLKQYYEISE